MRRPSRTHRARPISSSPSSAALRLAPTRSARQCVGRRCGALGTALAGRTDPSSDASSPSAASPTASGAGSFRRCDGATQKARAPAGSLDAGDGAHHRLREEEAVLEARLPRQPAVAVGPGQLPTRYSEPLCQSLAAPNSSAYVSRSSGRSAQRRSLSSSPVKICPSGSRRRRRCSPPGARPGRWRPPGSARTARPRESRRSTRARSCTRSPASAGRRRGGAGPARSPNPWSRSSRRSCPGAPSSDRGRRHRSPPPAWHTPPRRLTGPPEGVEVRSPAWAATAS